MAARIIAPKMASMAAQSTIKASRPVMRAGFQQQLATRSFSSAYNHQLGISPNRNGIH